MKLKLNKGFYYREGSDDVDILKELDTGCGYYKHLFELKNTDTIIDIGADIGTFSISAAKLVKKVYSFEPQKDNFYLFQKNIKHNNIKNIIAKNMAVFDKTGKKNLAIHSKSAQHSFFLNTQLFEKVKTINLKQVFDQNKINYCDFLKIDTEGSEDIILQSLPEKYFEKIGIIALEYHDYIVKDQLLKIVTLMDEYDFRIKYFYPEHQKGVIIFESGKVRAKSVLVTLADSNFASAAKQLFSSSYFNGRWQGDYLLLTDSLPEADLNWFLEKGILVKKCGDFKLASDPNRVGIWEDWLKVTIKKFYLFDTYFKKWPNVLFLDADIMVYKPLYHLEKVQGLWATKEWWASSVGENFHPFNKLDPKSQKKYFKFKNEYDLKAPAFNTGLMVFSTDIIKKDTFFRLKSLLKKYQKLEWLGDQAIFNLYFCKKWQQLPTAFNCYMTIIRRNKTIKPVTLHSVVFGNQKKFWDKNCPYYFEWKKSLDKADKIDLNKRPLSYPVSIDQIKNDSKKMAWQTILFKFEVNHKQLDRQIGLTGLFLKKYFPKLYYFLKKHILCRV